LSAHDDTDQYAADDLGYAGDVDSDALTFHIQNQPTWASFSAADGHMSGTPSAAAVGTYPDIVVSVSDGKSTAALPAFSVTVMAPAAADIDGDQLTFKIQNQPSWANFNSATGALTGNPTAANVNTYSNIIISVTDGIATTSLAPFSITVVQAANGSASLSWTAPTTNSDGSTLSNLAGYHVHYGTSTAMTQTAQVATAGVTTYTLNNLTSGTWYFAVSAYTGGGTESNLSNTVSKTIP
jgi:hypothetical protein